MTDAGAGRNHPGDALQAAGAEQPGDGHHADQRPEQSAGGAEPWIDGGSGWVARRRLLGSTALGAPGDGAWAGVEVIRHCTSSSLTPRPLLDSSRRDPHGRARPLPGDDDADTAVPAILPFDTAGMAGRDADRLHGGRGADGGAWCGDVKRHNKLYVFGRSKLLVHTADGFLKRILARAVIDASGTLSQPNPLGSAGVPAVGEAEVADRIVYGLPDVREQAVRYAGKRVLVVGAGHSAMNVLQDLVDLRRAAPATKIIWAVRRSGGDQLFGGGQRDGLPARGQLGAATRCD